jgi:hypothetical protein
MGVADAMGKPVLVVATGVIDPKYDIAVYPYIRARYDDENALRFGLVHFLRAPYQITLLLHPVPPTTKPLGDAVDRLFSRLRAEHPIKHEEQISIIATAIQESGVEILATKSRRSEGQETLADIAVWSDELTSIVGNPFPIEVCSSLMTEFDAESAVTIIMRAMMAAHVRWGLILFLKTSPDAIRVLSRHPVLAMSIEDFLENLRNRSFGRIVTDLRNRTVNRVQSDG